MAVDMPAHAAPGRGMVAYATQSFYHVLVAPLLALTLLLAYLARPSAGDCPPPPAFRRFHRSFMLVWALCASADWLQGPYVYALYDAYGYSTREIAELFVGGYASSLVFGCFVGAFADRFGRKASCVLYCLVYIMSCITKHFNHYGILMIGRITGGVATSMLYSCFECWMVREHQQRHGFPAVLLDYMFGSMYTMMYCVAIASGLVGQLVTDAVAFHEATPGSRIYFGGYLGPFDLSILYLAIGMIAIMLLWEENYGGPGPQESSAIDGQDAEGMLQSMSNALAVLRSDTRAVLVGIVVSAFEGSMFAFVFSWTPALESETVPLPHGVIFALFMMSCMCGASASTLIAPRSTVASRLMASFAASFVCFAVAALAAESKSEEHLGLSVFSFILFEFCVGMYFPSIGSLKSEVVPEHVRGTMYNMYRVPLNAIVVALLLGDMSMALGFALNSALMLVALASIMTIGRFPADLAPTSKVASIFEEPGAESVELENLVPSEDMNPRPPESPCLGATQIGRRYAHDPV